MKELSIEEKAKRYDEALEKSKILYEQGTITESLCYVFPELKESEDERIRKELIKLLRNLFNNYSYFIKDPFYTECIAWLEKQGDKDKLIKELGEYKVKYTQEVLEKHINSMSNKDDERLRKTTIAFLKDFAEKGYENAIECIDWLEKQGGYKLADNIESSLFRDKLLELFQRFRWYCKDETPTNGDVIEYVDAHIQELIDTTQKPTEWSEEDEDKVTIFMQLTEGCDNEKELADWLKSLKDRVLPQFKHEWSEEDKMRIKRLCDFVWANRKGDTDEISQQEKDVSWLKSLRPNHWKPSDEQIEALKSCVGNTWYDREALRELLEQLKKL